ncbi:L,D-transpeptidase family protein [Flaviflagellibacter deserti]|uniref:L,D-transpeptidase family protein n=1 Tax=Flaviflagellibacter deserti TaxID=2267266 RepID=A0ABV9Z4A1_9HYPH
MRHLGLGIAVLAALASPAVAKGLSPDDVNGASLENGEPSKAAILKAQVLLDRARYSPGAIDGISGDATEIALKAFQVDKELKPTGKLDADTLGKLTEADSAPIMMRYTITAQDLKGPFAEKIPDDIAEKAKLDRLSYTSLREELAERFHMDEELLKALNPDADFGKDGTEIDVVSVEKQEGRASSSEAAAERLVVDKSERTLRVFGKDNKLIALFPATIGSKDNPAPDGETKITRVARVPTWNYDPKLKLEGEKDRPDEPMTVKPGPNNPVGVVWIALDRDHFGIHGTPEPEKVGKNQSSGCVRLTNWDVEELAGMVKKGVPVMFEE